MSDKPEIPERWREVVSLSQRSPNHRNWHDDLKHCAKELGTAESRVRELEQERGAEGTNWFPESFVSQLQAQLAAVTQERDALKDLGSALVLKQVDIRTENSRHLAQLQAHNKRLRGALEELCGGIEDGGGTDGNGDTFDLTKAIAALTEEEKP